MAKALDKKEIALDFSTKAYKKFKDIIKCIVLFGSVAKESDEKKSDIDLIILIDDCSVNWDAELISWYREELAKLVALQKYRNSLHINTVTLTTFWEELRVGEPVIINILRYGEALIDFGGFFNPLKALLARGKIRATPEAVFATLKRAPDHLAKARFSLLGSIEALYWAMVDSAHAALMSANEIPPSPDHIGDLLTIHFVKSGKLDKKYVEWYSELYHLTREITHGNKKEIKVEEIKKHQERAEIFVKKMIDIAEELTKFEKMTKIN